MSGEAKSAACPLCGGLVAAGEKRCGQCGASAQWQDYVRAVDFARVEFTEWMGRGVIGQPNQTAMDQLLLAQRNGARAAVKENRAMGPEMGVPSAKVCWRCGRPIEGYYSYCNTCGSPLGEGADALRYLTFVEKQITRSAARQLTLAQAHACAEDVRGHASALRAEMERGRLSAAQLASERLSHLRDLKEGHVAPVVEAEPEVAPEPVVKSHTAPPPLPGQSRAARSAPPPLPGAVHRRSFLEILLDPHSIQWLLASGGVLLVVGLVIWLASLGLFKNAMVVAMGMGAGTLLLLGTGAAVIKLTRYQLAGRALALLACLVMPLNLWFYHAHGLVTLEGHLWVAALVCCVLYAAAAAMLEDAVFVYVLIAGVAMTGLLILADLHKLMEVASPVTWLVALGLVALHAERAFAPGEGAFSRKKFGMACFWSAQALLAVGFLWLLGAEIAGWVPMVMSWVGQMPEIVTDHGQRLLAVGLVLAGAYAYLYSDLVVRKVGVYVYIAAFMLLWAELLIIDLAQLGHHPSALIGALAITSLAVNVVQAMVKGKEGETTKLARPLPAFGVLLSAVPVLFGVVLHLRATRLDVYNSWPYSITWAYVGAMVLTAVCCRISAYLHERRMPRLAATYLMAAAAATLVGTAGLLSMLGVRAWPTQAVVLMVIPILYLLASRLYRGRPGEHPLKNVAHAATGVLLVSVFFSAMNLAQRVEPVVGVHTNLLLALFCAEAAIFYALAAIIYGGGWNVYLSTAMACGSLWQVLNYWDVRAEYYCVTFAVLGMALLAAYRAAAIEKIARPGLVVASFRCANALMSLSFVGAALMALSRLAVDQAEWSLVVLLGVFSLLGFVAAGLVQVSGFRRWYITVGVAEALLTFVVAQRQIHLSAWQNIEMFCVVVGVILLVIGYGLWYREQSRQSDAASFCLLFGSLLAGGPLAIAAIANRFWFDISLMDEIGLATVSILMFVSGFMCRLRAPTLIGGSLLAVHLAMLIVFAGMRAQLAVGVYLALGGAAIFAVGVVLSVYRERLLALPRQIRAHEGVFRVLAWR